MAPPNILVIVESPNKTAKIEAMYPNVKAMATFGHFCDLPASPTPPSIGINRATMQGEYALTKDSSRRVDGSRVIAKLKSYIATNPGMQIYLATDPDREGESIAAFAVKYLNLRSAKRMTFTAITKEKLQQAFANAGDIDWPAVASREARRLIDRIIGYTASPVLSKLVKQQKGVAAGRVQTAVEALVIERERKIRHHQPQPYYTVHYDLGGWTATWQVTAPKTTRTGPKPNSEYDIDDNTPRCVDQAIADRAASFKALTVVSCEDTVEDRLPPSPLDTISMLQVAGRALGWEADKTMQVAQKLFEGEGADHGHITYHRTDSINIDPGPAEDIRRWLREQNLPVPATPNHWKAANQHVQEGHEAIRPAYFEVEEAGINDEQRALYRIIRERAIYSQLAPARYAVKRIVLTDPGRNDHTFTALTRTLQDPGWLATAAAKSPNLNDGNDDAADQAAAVVLPNLKKGSLINTRAATIKPHTTKAPPRYTLDSLTGKLKTLAIGRPATMASLLKNVQAKGTIIVRKDKRLEPSPLAEKCYDILYPRFAFAHIGYTSELEQALDHIAHQKLDGVALTRQVWERLDADCAALIAPQTTQPPTQRLA